MDHSRDACEILCEHSINHGLRLGEIGANPLGKGRLVNG